MNPPNASDVLEKRRQSLRVVYAALLAVALGLSLAWFWSLPLQLNTFPEDDLHLLRLQQSGVIHSTFVQAIADKAGEKYRPVTALLFWVTFEAFDDNFRSYIILNTLLHAAVCAALGFCVWYYARVGLGFACGLTGLAAVSRFSYYNILQRHGLMEIVALALAGAVVAACCLYVSRRRRRHAISALVAFFLCIHTHERYLVLAPLLMAAFYLRRRPGWSLDWLLIASPVLLVAGNVLLKEFVLKIHFLTGTGGQHVDVHKTEILSFLGAGISSILGFDVGPAYLTALDFRALGPMGFAPLAVVVIGLLVLVLVAWRDGSLSLRMSALAVITLGALLFSASVTFRQEYRWLYSAELALLGFSAALAGRVVAKVRRQLAFLGLGLVLVGTAAANLVARYHATNIFFIGWLVNSESARSVIIEGTGPQLGHRPIYLIDYSINPLLFEQYAPGVKVTVLPVPSTALDRLTANEIREGLFYTVSNGLWHLVPITLPEGEMPLEPVDTATAADIALIPALRELLPNAPGSWYNTYNVALNFMTRNPRKAEYYLRQAIALVGQGNPYPYFSLGQLFHQKKNLPEALKYYELAVQYDTPPSRFMDAVGAVKKDMETAAKNGP